MLRLVIISAFFCHFAAQGFAQQVQHPSSRSSLKGIGTNPTATIQPPITPAVLVDQYTNDGFTTYIVTFSEPVSPTFTEDDILLNFEGQSFAGATINVTGADPEYLVTVTMDDPTTEGVLVMSVGTDIQDGAGESFSTAVFAAPVRFDVTPPTATLTSVVDNPTYLDELRFQASIFGINFGEDLSQSILQGLELVGTLASQAEITTFQLFGAQGFFNYDIRVTLQDPSANGTLGLRMTTDASDRSGNSVANAPLDSPIVTVDNSLEPVFGRRALYTSHRLVGGPGSGINQIDTSTGIKTLLSGRESLGSPLIGAGPEIEYPAAVLYRDETKSLIVVDSIHSDKAVDLYEVDLETGNRTFFADFPDNPIITSQTNIFELAENQFFSLAFDLRDGRTSLSEFSAFDAEIELFSNTSYEFFASARGDIALMPDGALALLTLNPVEIQVYDVSFSPQGDTSVVLQDSFYDGGTQTSLSQPLMITPNSQGDLFVLDQFTLVLYRIDHVTKNVSVAVDFKSEGGGPTPVFFNIYGDMVTEPDDRILILDSNQDIIRLDLDSKNRFYVYQESTTKSTKGSTLSNSGLFAIDPSASGLSPAAAQNWLLY